MIEILSELFLPYAISVRLSATNCAGDTCWSSLLVLFNMDLRRRLRIWRATSPTSSLVITSQSPSLANIKHSSSSVLVVKVISGTGIIHGLRYLSPETCHTVLISTTKLIRNYGRAKHEGKIQWLGLWNPQNNNQNYQNPKEKKIYQIVLKLTKKIFICLLLNRVVKVLLKISIIQEIINILWTFQYYFPLWNWNI